MKPLFLALLFFTSIYSSGQEYQVEFEISNLRNTDGSIIVSVYKDSTSFANGMPEFRQTFSKKENSTDGTFRAQFSLPSGVYGLVFLDDENNDGAMNNNLIGIPKEGFGFSGYYLKGFNKPKFSDFSFILTEDFGTMQVRLRYL
jgi:uncharacterized protein (DUF2141 family)